MMLKDKIALITGSTNNIGLEVVRTFAREGATVIVNSRHQQEAKTIAEELNGDYFQADVARPEQVEALFEHIRTEHERLDILVNCVAHRPKNDLMELRLKNGMRSLQLISRATFSASSRRPKL